mgnify:CR=1 FL=1
MYKRQGPINSNIKVVRNDQFKLDDIKQWDPSHIVISPGPGRPEDAGHSIDVIKKYGASIPILGVIQRGLEPWNSYPSNLQGKLRQAYQYQAPSVINEGVAGERAADAPARLRAALNRHQPDVVILMEGTNDLGAADAEESARDQLALDGIEEMLDDIKSANATAILATIAPVRESGPGIHTALVGPYKTQLRSIAASRGIQLVDVHALLSDGACQPMSCIGDDNIHPTVQGYSVMADAFYERLVTLYDVPITVPTAVGFGSEVLETSWSR